MSSVPPSALVPIGPVVSPVEPVFGLQDPSIFTLDGRSYWRNRFTIRRFPERVTPLPLPAPLPRLALSSTQAAPVQEPLVTVEEPEEPVQRVLFTMNSMCCSLWRNVHCEGSTRVPGFLGLSHLILKVQPMASLPVCVSTL